MFSHNTKITPLLVLHSLIFWRFGWDKNNTLDNITIEWTLDTLPNAEVSIHRWMNFSYFPQMFSCCQTFDQPMTQSYVDALPKFEPWPVFEQSPCDDVWPRLFRRVRKYRRQSLSRGIRSQWVHLSFSSPLARRSSDLGKKLIADFDLCELITNGQVNI